MDQHVHAEANAAQTAIHELLRARGAVGGGGGSAPSRRAVELEEGLERSAVQARQCNANARSTESDRDAPPGLLRSRTGRA